LIFLKIKIKIKIKISISENNIINVEAAKMLK
jgi:hypothetical protein